MRGAHGTTVETVDPVHLDAWEGEIRDQVPQHRASESVTTRSATMRPQCDRRRRVVDD